MESRIDKPILTVQLALEKGINPAMGQIEGRLVFLEQHFCNEKLGVIHSLNIVCIFY